MPNSKLRGVIAAVATPINEDGSPDVARATTSIAFLIRFSPPNRTAAAQAWACL